MILLGGLPGQTTKTSLRNRGWRTSVTRDVATCNKATSGIFGEKAGTVGMTHASGGKKHRATPANCCAESQANKQRNISLVNEQVCPPRAFALSPVQAALPSASCAPSPPQSLANFAGVLRGSQFFIFMSSPTEFERNCKICLNQTGPHEHLSP